MGNNDHPKYGFEYDGEHTDDYNIIVTRRFRHAGPPLDHSTLSIPFMEGEYPTRIDSRGATIELELFVESDGPEDLRDKIRDISAWLKPTIDEYFRPEPKPIIFTDEPEKRWMGYPVTRLELSEKANRAEGSINLFCPNPFAEALETRTTGPEDENEGTVPSPPIITVTMTESSDDLKVQYENKELFLDKELETGDVIVFDKTKRLVLVNDEDAREDLTYTSRWFDLKPGNFSITTDPDSTVEVEFREMWR